MPSARLNATCLICGRTVEAHASQSANGGERSRRVQNALRHHLEQHSFAEVLRYEIRQDLDQVPCEQRAIIVRDIYRQLLGRFTNGRFSLGAADSLSVYSIDEALGSIAMYTLWLQYPR